jgi:hypothetical protein
MAAKKKGPQPVATLAPDIVEKPLAWFKPFAQVNCMRMLHECQREVATIIGERLALARDAEGLTRRAADEDFGWFDAEAAQMPRTERREVSPKRDGPRRGPVAKIPGALSVLQDRDRGVLDLGEIRGAPAQRFDGHRDRLHAGTDAAERDGFRAQGQPPF